MSDAIAGEFGFRPEVILRTVDEMRKIVARNPFADSLISSLASCWSAFWQTSLPKIR
jgi:uncharacterized protein (DUF1697 family)